MASFATAAYKRFRAQTIALDPSITPVEAQYLWTCATPIENVPDKLRAMRQEEREILLRKGLTRAPSVGAWPFKA